MIHMKEQILSGQLSFKSKHKANKSPKANPQILARQLEL